MRNEASMPGRWLRLLCMFGLVIGIQMISGAITSAEVRDWYPTLVKPAWNPPDGVFGPVWTVLYIAIAIAGWRVWEEIEREGGGWCHPALRAFAVQLALNFLWSILFFGQHWTMLAFAEIVLLLIAIGVTIARFRRIDKPAAILLWPYFAWVAFATSLNGGIVWLNQ